MLAVILIELAIAAAIITGHTWLFWFVPEPYLGLDVHSGLWSLRTSGVSRL